MGKTERQMEKKKERGGKIRKTKKSNAVFLLSLNSLEFIGNNRNQLLAHKRDMESCILINYIK